MESGLSVSPSHPGQLSLLPSAGREMSTGRRATMLCGYGWYYVSRESQTTRNVLWSPASCVSVCLSAAACLHYCTDPDVTWASDRMPPICALLGGFAIGARVALLWQHNANPSYKLACTLRYDNIVYDRSLLRTLFGRER